MAHALDCPALPKPRFCYSPVVKAGPWLRFSGMVALHPETGALEPGGSGPEAARIMANLAAALPSLGLTLDDLVSARIFVCPFDGFPAVNAAWEAAMEGVAQPPARTSIGVAALPLGASVEIEFDFYRE